jgi:hypothetical protein
MDHIVCGIQEVEITGLFVMMHQVVGLQTAIPREAVPDRLFRMEALMEVVDPEGIETGLRENDHEHPRSGDQVDHEPHAHDTIQVVILEHRSP